jgi:hypothetical protein
MSSLKEFFANIKMPEPYGKEDEPEEGSGKDYKEVRWCGFGCRFSGIKHAQRKACNTADAYPCEITGKLVVRNSVCEVDDDIYYQNLIIKILKDYKRRLEDA